METGRLEAFSDGVIAIIITIMVLEMKVPHGKEFSELAPMLPVLVSYVLSFVYVGIYWNNHHHMFQVSKKIDGSILWANLHLLFWMSLIPFVTGWMGENNFASAPTALYGVVLFMTALAYYLLTRRLVRLHGKKSIIGAAIGKDYKGIISLVVYLAGVMVSFINPWISLGLYISVAIMWFLPDRRIEKQIS